MLRQAFVIKARLGLSPFRAYNATAGAEGLLSPLCGLNLRCPVCSLLRPLARSASWLVGFSLLSNVVSFPCPSHLDPNTTLLLGLYLSPALTPWLLYVEATPVVLAVVVAVTVTGSDVHRGRCGGHGCAGAGCMRDQHVLLGCSYCLAIASACELLDWGDVLPGRSLLCVCSD